jgi:drug/metabolite transporter (DMT)-like permease
MSVEASIDTPRRDIKGWIVFVVLAFVWGGSFILIKKGLIHFSAIEVGALRIFISALAFVPTFFLARVKFPKGKVLIIATTTFIGNAIPAFLFALAETRLGSAVTGVLNSLSPIFAVILAIAVFKTPFKRHYILGLLFGCLGIVLLMIGEKDWQVSYYIFYVIVATFCYGFSVNLVKKYGQGVHPISFTAIGFISLGWIAALILWKTGGLAKIFTAEVWMDSMPALVTLAIVCTVFANILFNWLIQRTNAVFSSAIAYAIPCMALVWGGLDGEVITWYQIMGLGLIGSAIYTLRRR